MVSMVPVCLLRVKPQSWRKSVDESPHSKNMRQRHRNIKNGVSDTSSGQQSNFRCAVACTENGSELILDDTRGEINGRSDKRSRGALLARMRLLWDEAEEIWDRCQDDREYRDFVAADYERVFRTLQRLRNRGTRILEWGSGLGVVTIMASNLGFDAYGMETESHLVDQSRQLAMRHGPQAKFAKGNFIPNHYQWQPEYGAANLRTICDAKDGYDELGMDLRDFDLVYAYPWPDERDLYEDILRRCGRRDALFMTYNARTGIALNRIDDHR